MNLKLSKLFSVSGLVAVVVATCVPMADAETLVEKRLVGSGIVECERTLVAPAATAVTTEKVLEHGALLECAPMATTTTTEKITETERWTSSARTVRRAFRRSAPRKRMTMARRPSARRFVAHKWSAKRFVAHAPRIRERVITKTVVVEKPVFVEKQVVLEKPVYIERVIERPVLLERCVEQPVLLEKCVEKPVIIEKTIQQPVIIREKKRKALNLGLMKIRF